jgi:Holliday junction resolvasome RuvABC endonuclease subunit
VTVKVTGLDLSMTATGVAHSSIEGETLAACTHLIAVKGTRDSRLMTIKNQVREYVRGSELVLIEDLPRHAMAAGITGMVQGSVRTMLLEESIPYASLPPASLKKFATGRGNASKTDMAVAAYKRGAVEFTNDNECDAWWLWVATMDHLGAPVFDLPKTQREALAKIKMES